MARRLLPASLLVALTLTACGAPGSADGGSGGGTANGTGGAGGTTFCAIIRSERERCASGSDSTTSTVERCDENIAACMAAPSAFNETRNMCVTTTTFQMSRFNAGLKPFPGTCSEYRQYQQGTISCLSTEDISPLVCRNGQPFCGTTPYPGDLPARPLCDGARLMSSATRCVAGTVTTTTSLITDCGANGKACVTSSGVGACATTGAGGGSGSTGGGAGSGGGTGAPGGGAASGGGSASGGGTGAPGGGTASGGGAGTGGGSGPPPPPPPP